MKNKKKKPTNKDFVHVINGLLSDIQALYRHVQAQTIFLKEYIEFSGHTEKWLKHMETMKEKDERDRLNKTNDKANSDKSAEGK